MSVKMLFEDNEKSILSTFLRNAYNEECIIFTNGNYNLSLVLDSVWKSDDFYLVYIDVVPDNSKTIDIYEALLDLVADKGWLNVRIIPIPCIEYYILMELWEKNDTVNCVLNKGAYKATDLYRASGACAKSFEKYCKQLVSNTGDNCKRVASLSKVSPSTRGRYYITDCLCSNVYTNIGHVAKSLESKAVDVIRRLPVYVTPPSIKKEVPLLSVKQIDEIVIRQQKILVDWYDLYVQIGYV